MNTFLVEIVACPACAITRVYRILIHIYEMKVKRAQRETEEEPRDR